MKTVAPTTPELDTKFGQTGRDPPSRMTRGGEGR
jgi:hypothetical protein